MRIGILGTGDVGRTLGSALVELGHEVKLGARESSNETASTWAREVGAGASSGTFADAAQFGEMVVLATLGVANEQVLKAAGVDKFDGKLVIDVTNPLDFSQGLPPSLAVGHTDSGGEQVQRWIPRAHVVKAFNTVGAAHMFRPQFPGGPPDMFLCGNDASAKAKVSELLQQFGWNSIDLGGIDRSRYLEPLCLVWVLFALQSGGWNHAFKMLRG